MFGSTSNTFGGAGGASGGGGGLFGNTANAFGVKPAGTTGGFGVSSAPATGGGLFGAKPAGSTGFGVMGSAVGAPTAVITEGTLKPAYQPTREKDAGTNQNAYSVYQSITCMKEYRDMSMDELRLQDYQQGRKTAPAPGTTGFGTTSTGGGLFGQPQATGGGLFGQQQQQQPSTTSGFGATTGGGLFGSTGNAFGQQTNTAASGFGSTAPAGGLFGQQAQQQQPQQAGGLFGQQQPAAGGGLFGSSTPSAFGQQPQQPAATGFGGFGAQSQPAAKPAFGFGASTTSTPPAFGQPAATQPSTGFSFGQQPQQQQQQPASTGFGGFGATPAPAAGGLFGATSTQQQPQQMGGGLFGAAAQSNAPKPGGLFGATSTTGTTGGGLFGGGSTGLFGANANQQQGQQPQQQAQQTSTGLFGATSNTGATTGTGLFGQQQQPQQQAAGTTFGGFGQTQNNAPKPGGLFGSLGSTAAPAAQTTVPGTTGFGGFGGFGANANQSTTGTTGGLFGGANNQSQMQQPAAGGGLFGGFNKPAAPAGGLFGSTSSAPAQTGGGLFGGGLGQSINQQQPQQQFGSSSLFGGSTSNQQQNQQQPQLNLNGIAQSISTNPYGSNDLLSSVSSFQPIKTTTPASAPLPPLSSSVKAFPTPTRSNVRLRGFASPATPKLGASQLGMSVNGSKPGLFDSISPNTINPNAFTPRKSVKKLVLDKRTTGANLRASLMSNPKLDRSMLNPDAERESTYASSVQDSVIDSPIKKKSTMTMSRSNQKSGLDAYPRTVDLDALDEGEYYTLPEMSVLCNASHADLASVNEFVVGRKGYGELRYLEPVDLNTVTTMADIPGTLVLFERLMECEVYPEGTDGQEPGHGLNHRARISLEKCWPIERSTQKPIRDPNHPKLKAQERRCKNQPGTEFVSFDPETGKWVFEVEHFTKYGLDSDEEEENETEIVEDASAQSSVASMDGEGEEYQEEDTVSSPHDPSDDEDEDELETEEEESEEDDVGDGPTPWNGEADVHRLNVMQASLFGNGNKGMESRQELVQPYFLRAEEGLASTDLEMDHPLLGDASTTIDAQLPEHARLQDDVVQDQDLDDVFSERSLSNEWDQLDEDVAKGSEVEQPKSKPVDVAASNLAREMTDVQIQHSQLKDIDDVPLFTVNPSLRLRHFANLFAADQSYEGTFWRLASSLFDPLETPDLEDIRRKLGLSKWLEQVVSSTVEHELLSAPAGPATVFVLLSGHQIERAVDAAISSGDVRLATLISQIGGDERFRADIRAQINEWRAEKADGHISPEYKKVYALLAGMVDVYPGNGSQDHVDRAMDVDLTQDLDWLRVFGLHLWYGSQIEDSVHVALDSYSSYLKTAGEDRQPYFKSKGKNEIIVQDSSSIQDARYQLLQFFRGEKDVLGLCNPASYGMALTCRRLQWHLLSTEPFASQIGLSVRERLTREYSDELETLNLWERSVFVSLTLESATDRQNAVKALLARHVEQVTATTTSALVNTYDVPLDWIHEAKADYAAKVKDYYTEYIESKSAGLFDRAHSIAIQKLVSEPVLMQDPKTVLRLFIELEDRPIATWEERGKIFLQFANLCEILPGLAHVDSRDNVGLHVNDHELVGHVGHVLPGLVAKFVKFHDSIETVHDGNAEETKQSLQLRIAVSVILSRLQRLAIELYAVQKVSCSAASFVKLPAPTLF